MVILQILKLETGAPSGLSILLPSSAYLPHISLVTKCCLLIRVSCFSCFFTFSTFRCHPESSGSASPPHCAPCHTRPSTLPFFYPDILVSPPLSIRQSSSVSKILYHLYSYVSNLPFTIPSPKLFQLNWSIRFSPTHSIGFCFHPFPSAASVPLLMTSSSSPQTGLVPVDDLELLILLPLLIQCRNYRHTPPCLAYAVLRIDPRASCNLGKRCTNELSHIPSPLISVSIFPITQAGQKLSRSPQLCWAINNICFDDWDDTDIKSILLA